jgi:hypothetical protein
MHDRPSAYGFVSASLATPGLPEHEGSILFVPSTTRSGVPTLALSRLLEYTCFSLILPWDFFPHKFARRSSHATLDKDLPLTSLLLIEAVTAVREASLPLANTNKKKLSANNTRR